MITVEEALDILSAHAQDFGTEEIDLDHAVGRVLREEIRADRDFPPYNRVTMDGIAIHYESFKNGRRSFAIEGMAAAGDPQQTLREGSACLEVMTGAIMPTVADTVVRYEDVSIENGHATITTDTINMQQNIHFKGEDRKEGAVVIGEGKTLYAPEIGVCATVGKKKVQVSRLPRTLIISTGDELVEIDKHPLPHQIRRSNVYQLKTLLQDQNIPVEADHLNDDYEQIVKTLDSHIGKYDVILLSGGISKGKFDFIPKALEELGVEKLFYRIKQRPGKPFWFGKHAGGCHIFALPGNPVSSFLCTQRYFNHWLDLSLQKKNTSTPLARLTQDVTFQPDLTYFLQVRLYHDTDGHINAEPVKGHGSGDLANLVDADAFIELPGGRNVFTRGEVFPFYAFR